MDKISIIIPVYNVEKYLEKCLDSVVGQTYANLEIVCVNDGSKDGSLAILEEYARKDSRVKLISRENRGMSRTRNDALDVATGEWIMFLDSDDWIDGCTCEKAMEAAVEHNADVVSWAYVREYQGRPLPKLYATEKRVWDKDITDFHRRVVGPVGKELSSPDTVDAWGTCWAKLYKASYIQGNRPVRFVELKEIGSSEDALFNIHLLGQVKRAVYLPELWNHYRKCSSATSRYKSMLPQQWNTLFTMIDDEIARLHLGEEFREALRSRIVLGIIGLGLNELSPPCGLWGKYKGIDRLLSNNRYREAVKDFPLKELPLHWKVLVGAAKYRMTSVVLFLLLIINRILNRGKEA